MNDRYSPSTLDLQKDERSLTYGGNLYGLSRSIALHAVVSNHEPSGQRKYPRHQPDIKMYLLHSTLGTVTDISMDGLSYTYYQLSNIPSRPLPETGTIFSAERGILKDIPFTVITDTVKVKSPPRFPELNQRRIAFDGITAKQCEMLEAFILSHVIMPKSDINNDHGWCRQPKLAHVKRESHNLQYSPER